MWERFSYYGMRSLLVLYMTKYLLLADHSGNVVGLLGLKRALESIFGPLDVQPLSSQIWGLYTGLVYFTPIFGGLLADRVLGQRRTVVIGAVLMAIGHFMMAVEQLFLFALFALILGSGCFKPNISTQVGGLYAPGDPRRDRAYSIFYVGINVGAFLAPLFAARSARKSAGTTASPPPASACASGFASISTRCRICRGRVAQGEGGRRPKHRPLAPRRMARHRRAARAVRAQHIVLGLTYEQIGNTTILWIDADVDRTIGLFGWAARIPTTWFLAFNPFMIFAFTPFVVALWARQAARGSEPSTMTKMALGCFGVTAANLIMAFAAFHAGAGQASWLWVLGSIAIITVGELYLSPVGLSLVTKVAPVRLLSMLMGMWLATSFTGGFLAGYHRQFLEPHAACRIFS